MYVVCIWFHLTHFAGRHKCREEWPDARSEKAYNLLLVSACLNYFSSIEYNDCCNLFLVSNTIGCDLVGFTNINHGIGLLAHCCPTVERLAQWNGKSQQHPNAASRSRTSRCCKSSSPMQFYVHRFFFKDFHYSRWPILAASIHILAKSVGVLDTIFTTVILLEQSRDLCTVP